MSSNDKAFRLECDSEVSGVSVREMLGAESIDFTDGAREETRTPTPSGTGS